jgi:hypothetical protein
VGSLLLAMVAGLAIPVVYRLYRHVRTTAEAQPPFPGSKTNDVTDEDLPDAAKGYLTAVDARLEMPDWLRADIYTELSDHLRDSIAAIESEGLDADRAAGEALARLGSPADLASQMRRAHQTPRRLLAGAAGGIIQTGVGFIYGLLAASLLGVLVAIFATLLVTGLLKAPIGFVAGLLPNFSTDSADLATNSVVTNLLLCVAASISARRGAQAFADSSRRAPSRVAPLWGIAGAAILALLALFVVDAQQSWLSVLVELLIPVAFAAGAIVRFDRGIALPWGRVALAGVAITIVSGVGFISATGVSTSNVATEAVEITPLLAQFDRVAPWWQETRPTFEGSASSCCGDEAHESVTLDAVFLSSFHDIRFELWRAVPWPGAPAGNELGLYTVDGSYAAPIRITPAQRTDGTLTASFDLRRYRSNHWLIFLTATGPDGRHYRLLGMPDDFHSSFSGTVWDWLTASD